MQYGPRIAWLEHPPLAGIEGVVAKRDEAYPAPTARRWRKIRRLTTIDFRVLGFVGDLVGHLDGSYFVSPPAFLGGDSSSRLTWARRGFTQPRL